MSQSNIEKRKPGRPLLYPDIEVTCKICGKGFFVKPYKNRLFCSRACTAINQHENREYPKQDLLTRMMSSIKVDPETGCWIWQKGLHKAGYAKVKIRDRAIRQDLGGHVVLYELMRGKVPEGLELDHLCRVRACVNPYHMEAVTHRVNMLRSPICPAAINARRTHCVNGHEFTQENTYLRALRSSTVGAKRGRMCITCRDARARARYRRKVG